MSKVVPANIFFERTDDGDMVYIEYYLPLERSKRLSITRKEWEDLLLKKGGEE